MKVIVCVDYLSHSWDPEDLLCSYHETKKKIAEVRQLTTTNDDKLEMHRRNLIWTKSTAAMIKEKHRLLVEENRLQRFQNALWRQMARRCTSNLSKGNKLVNPCVVNWQKECDITWLYGPLYEAEEDDSNHRCNFLDECPPDCSTNPMDYSPSKSEPVCPSTSPPLKPALKRRTSLSRQAEFDSLLQSWSGKTKDDTVACKTRTKRSNSWPSLRGSRSLPTTRSSQTKSIRFNPDISKLEYVPSHPVYNIVPCDPSSTPRPKPKPKARQQVRPSAAKNKSSVSFCTNENRSLVPANSSRGLSEACFNLAATVKDIITLCGVIVIYRSISVGVSPIVWLAQHWVQHLAGREIQT